MSCSTCLPTQIDIMILILHLFSKLLLLLTAPYHSHYGSHRVLCFWLLVASLVRGVAMPLMQCPYYQYTGANFADLGSKTG